MSTNTKMTIAAVANQPAHDTNTTRPVKGPLGFNCPVLGQVSFDECLAHARQMQGVPQCGFSLPTLIGMVKHLNRHDPELEAITETNPHFTFRVSALTGPCAKEAVLHRLVGREAYSAPQSTYWTWRGEIIHAIKQTATEPQDQNPTENDLHNEEATLTVVNEQRLTCNLSVVIEVAEVGLVEVEVTLTGKPDTIFVFSSQLPLEQLATNPTTSEAVPTLVTLIDYKTSDYIPNEAKPEHAAQVNLYNYLRLRSGLPGATKLAISYISLKGEAHRPVVVWSVEAVEAYLVSQLLPQLESLLALKPATPLSKGSAIEGEVVEQTRQEQYLPPRLDPLDSKAGGWKCDGYCQFTARCWPEGVPGAKEKAAAKAASASASKRAFYGALLNPNQ